MTSGEWKNLVDSLKEIAESLNDIRGVMMDMAPKKTLGQDGEVVSETAGYLERMIKKAVDENKVNKIDGEVQWLSTYVKEKNSYVLSTKETKYILNVIDSKLNDIRADLKGIK